jgi:hypothetical protein
MGQEAAYQPRCGPPIEPDTEDVQTVDGHRSIQVTTDSYGHFPIQAILWYFEQQLFNSMGQTSAKPSKFSDGAKQFRDAGERGRYGQP